MSSSFERREGRVVKQTWVDEEGIVVASAPDRATSMSMSSCKEAAAGTHLLTSLSIFSHTSLSGTWSLPDTMGLPSAPILGFLIFFPLGPSRTGVSTPLMGVPGIESDVGVASPDPNPLPSSTPASPPSVVPDPEATGKEGGGGATNAGEGARDVFADLGRRMGAGSAVDGCFLSEMRGAGGGGGGGGGNEANDREAAAGGAAGGRGGGGALGGPALSLSRILKDGLAGGGGPDIFARGSKGGKEVVELIFGG